MARVVFVFDRVMHYHRPVFEQMERRLQQRGHELFLVSGKEKQHATGRAALIDPVIRNQIQFALSEWPVGRFMLRWQHGVARTIRELKPKIVVTMCHSGTFSEWQLIALKRNLGFKLVAWQCGYEFNPGRFKRWILGMFIPCFDHHLAYHTNAKYYALAHGARASQITVMHNTIDEGRISRIGRDEARSYVRHRHPEISDRKIVLFVGAILVEKRIELILDALDLMQRTDVVLVLVGDGEHMRNIRARCATRNDVVLAGAIVDGVGPYFDAAEVYVLPGTGGLGINEAMAHSLPVVSGYADGSADDLVIDGENGFRLRDNTAVELAGRLSTIIESPELSRSMGERSRMLIEDRFAFHEFIDRIVTTLTRLAS